MQLSRWGWSPEWRSEFEKLKGRSGAAVLYPARVARHDRTGYLVVHEDGDAFARLPGHLREEPPAVGDWIALDPRDPPTIRALLPRRSAFVRQAAGREAKPQFVAANVDVLFLVAGLDGDLNARRLERYLVLAVESGARAVVVLNKADLAEDAEAAAADVRAIAGDAPIVVTSAQTMLGIHAIRGMVPPGVTAAFLGSSGVGKSSLVNALVGTATVGTGLLRAKDGRGRHTTTARHLIPIPEGGILLDTPGMREIHLWDAETGIAAVFDDIETLARGCRFRDCAHDREPGCAVRASAIPERIEAWRKLQREAASAARRADVARSRADARAWGKMGRESLRAKRDRLS